ncbi:MAG: hypothetical protein ACOVP7_12120 [Lacibacter sp.]
MHFKDELQNIISGVGQNAEENLIQAAANYLRAGQKTGGSIEADKLTKDEEAKKLIEWAGSHHLLLKDIDETRFIARGAEQRVYLDTDVQFVRKLNDAVFYLSWTDYFISLQIHNLFFSGTAYELIGFYVEKNILHAVVKQPYIQITDSTDVEHVKQFLLSNGFQLKKNNDYYNTELGIILEDLHDENVLMNNDTLFFIDTVFYVMH